MKWKPLLIALLAFSPLVCYAQSPEIASIERSLHNIKDSSRYVDALNRVAMLLYERDVDSTFYYVKKARSIADRLNYTKGQADALNNLGIVFFIKENSQELSLKYFNEAQSKYTQLHDTANVVQALMNIALAYNSVGKGDRSLKYIELAFLTGKNLKHDSIMSLVIDNYLLYFPNRIDHRTVVQLVDRGLRITDRYKDDRSRLELREVVAGEMISRGDKKGGLTLLDSVINACFNKKLYYLSMDMLIDMGDHLAKDSPVKAAGYYQKGLDTAEKYNFRSYRGNMARKLFDFYSIRHDIPRAAQYANKLIALHDEQEKINNTSSIDYLDYAIKDQQFRALATQSKYQVIFLILAIVICLLAVLVIFVIRRTLKRTQKLNRQMHIALGALEQSQAENSRVMKIVAHDLRNPISAIIMAVKVIRKKDGHLEANPKMLEIVKRAADNSLALVNDLLQAPVNAGELKKEPINLEQMLHYCTDLLLHKARAKKLQLNLQAPQEVVVSIDNEKMWRVVSNLIANAIKFSPHGAVIEVRLTEKPGYAVVEVEDRGLGIPEEAKDKVFDMFTEARRAGTAGEKSFGMGLAISKQIVQAHGGKIWFESKPGKGTTFFVELPL